MKKSFLFIATLFLSLSMANGQELVPATSEDIEQFDRQLSEKQEKPREKTANFGQAVSAEAKRLKETGGDKKEFGKWVSDQRRKNDDGRPDPAGASAGSAGDRGKSDSIGNAGKRADDVKGPKRKDK